MIYTSPHQSNANTCINSCGVSLVPECSYLLPSVYTDSVQGNLISVVSFQTGTPGVTIHNHSTPLHCLYTHNHSTSLHSPTHQYAVDPHIVGPVSVCGRESLQVAGVWVCVSSTHTHGLQLGVGALQLRQSMLDTSRHLNQLQTIPVHVYMQFPGG